MNCSIDRCRSVARARGSPVCNKLPNPERLPLSRERAHYLLRDHQSYPCHGVVEGFTLVQLKRVTRRGEYALAEMLHFEDLQVGQRWLSPARTITADDVTDFAELTGDHTALHAKSDEDGEPTSPFRQPVAHGLLGLSVLAGLSSEHPRVQTLALVGLGGWDFRHPIYFGDTVHVETQIVAIEPHGRRAGRVTWHRRLVGSRGQVLQEGSLVTLVATRTPRPRIAATVDRTYATAELPKMSEPASHPR